MGDYLCGVCLRGRDEWVQILSCSKSCTHTFTFCVQIRFHFCQTDPVERSAVLPQVANNKQNSLFKYHMSTRATSSTWVFNETKPWSLGIGTLIILHQHFYDRYEMTSNEMRWNQEWMLLEWPKRKNLLLSVQFQFLSDFPVEWKSKILRNAYFKYSDLLSMKSKTKFLFWFENWNLLKLFSIYAIVAANGCSKRSQ